MADIAAGARQPALNEWAASRAVGLPRNSIGRRLAQMVAETVIAAGAVVTRPRRRTRPKQPHYHRRESFVEEAAMSREMFRL
ncbi:hypothetical protein [Mycobacterium sp. 1245805.9]|uniref:hypothetical protein n=1 Tax=Mycobacterium sp. 1245805.9 TaxID=1856862 RepID=UPI0007FD9C3F|nr:hypothetical protein [Mycobacterium sp. 1245805.9]OBI81061.1 hypothetical protein A9X00_09655 [Mycobacterium sp. 1245805.9]